MWKAKKIELLKNSATSTKNDYYFEDCYSLIIDDDLISNAIESPAAFHSVSNFQTNICSFCGHPGCNAGGILMMRKHKNTLLVLPDFDAMEEFAEYHSDNSEGDTECPPHKWFTHGILVVEGKELLQLYKLLPGLTKADIPEVSQQELDYISEWELLVLQQPKGFINEYNLKNNKP